MRSIEEIRQAPFGELTPSEKAAYMSHDVEEYFAKTDAWAHEMVLAEASAIIRRRAQMRRERFFAFLRRLWSWIPRRTP